MTNTNTLATVVQDADITRTVSETSLAAGESTTVELSADFEDELGEQELLRVTDQFSNGFEEIETTDITPSGGTGGSGPDNEEVVVVWKEDADSYSLTYEVTVPPTAAAGETFEITGTLEIGDAEQPLPSETITVDEGATGIQLAPSEASIDADGETTFGLAMTGGDDGVGSYSMTVEVDDTSVAEITDVVLTGEPETDNSEIAADGSSATVDADMGDSAHDGATSIDLAELTVAASAEGTAELSLRDGADVVDSGSESYDLDFLADASLTVQEIAGICAYTDEDGTVDIAHLQDGIADWRTGEIGFDMLTDIISAWREGGALPECE